MKKFKTHNYFDPKIDIVEVDRETAGMVFIKNRRYSKSSDFHSFFDTYEEAYAHLVRVNTKRVAMAQEKLDWAASRLAKVSELTNPELSNPPTSAR